MAMATNLIFVFRAYVKSMQIVMTRFYRDENDSFQPLTKIIKCVDSSKRLQNVYILSTNCKCNYKINAGTIQPQGRTQ